MKHTLTALALIATPAWAVDVPDQPVKVVVTNPAPVNVQQDQRQQQKQKQQQQQQQQQGQQQTGGTQTVTVDSRSISSASVNASGDAVAVAIGPLGMGIPTTATNAGKWVGIAAATGANPTAMACTYRRYKRAYPHLCGVAANRAAITDQTYRGSKLGVPVVTTRETVDRTPVGRGGDR